MAKSLIDLAFDALQSELCICGSRKQQNKAFCYGCFKELPGHLKSNLWRGLRDGFAEIWDEACTFLRAETERIPR